MEQLGTKRSLTPNSMPTKIGKEFIQVEDLANLEITYSNENMNSNETLDNEDVDERTIFPKDSPKRTTKSYTMAENY